MLYVMLCVEIGRQSTRAKATRRRSAGSAGCAPEQLVAQKLLQHHPRSVASEGMVAAADHMDVAPLRPAPQCGSGLQLQQLDAGLALREHDRDLNAAPRNLLELPGGIVGQ